MQKFGEQLHRLILAAYDANKLAPVLYFRLGVRLDQVAPTEQDFGAVVFRVLLWADQHGRTLALAEAVAADRPDRADLTDLYRRMSAAAAPPPPAPPVAAPVALPDALTGLIRGYERLRRVMPPSDQRTVLLEEMVTKLRAADLAPFDLPGRCHLSDSAGERLAAVVALRQRPAAAYLRWLGERVAVEDAFAGYHAAVALVEAARGLPADALEAVADAVDDARGWLTATPGRHSGRRDKLAEAKAALARR